MPKTLFEKLWTIHEVVDLGDGDSLMHIDRIFLHERTGSIALQGLEDKKKNHISATACILYYGPHCGHHPGA
jgi:3-isopropylmalate/(R)-2-methylmalate dehydratase large subunit